MSDTAQPVFDPPATRPNARRDLSASAIAAGLVAVLVSFGGTAVLMVQAGHAAGLDAARIGSWIGSLSLVLGVGGAAYSLRTGLPIVMAWSTPAPRCWSPRWPACLFPKPSAPSYWPPR